MVGEGGGVNECEYKVRNVIARLFKFGCHMGVDMVLTMRSITLSE